MMSNKSNDSMAVIRAALANRTPGEWEWHNRVEASATDPTVIGYDRLEAYEGQDGEDVIAWRKTAWLAVKPADATIIENAPGWLEELLKHIDNDEDKLRTLSGVLRTFVICVKSDILKTDIISTPSVIFVIR